MPDTFADRIATYTERVEERLNAALPLPSTDPGRLHEAMRYAVLNGGKRVRPLLVYAAGECLGVDAVLLDAPAVAIELIHAFSLVHDDLPAMDDDDLRRGNPTVHIKYNEATAILAADALQPLAFSVLSQQEHVPATVKIDLVSLIANACGSTGMTGGQSIDLAAEGSSLSAEALELMYSLKTGALIHAAVMSACLLREDLREADTRAVDAFGRAVGVAFQIKDDILDIEGETHVIGKQVGADQRLGKATYPGLFGLDRSRQRCDELLNGALHHLERFGDAAAPLKWLARFIVERGQ
ncbi:MAG: polyprenyl synthetase family protein [Gammaproteobacteria bacterium]|nr:polyprenyl synthetase family protein [Gammaproteobacteria bacterium]